MSNKYAIIGFLTKVTPDPSAQSDYEKYYSQFVDSKRPLTELMDDDLNNWIAVDASRPILSEAPDPNRTDYFDIPYGMDPMQKLDIHHLNGSQLRPVIVYIHGGGWVSGDKTQTRYAGPTLISLGYTFVSINYRLAPQNPHPAQIEDCAMALKWVIDNISNYGGDPNNIGLIGESSGGHLTALLATGTKWHTQYNIDMKKVKCWVAISGIHDFKIAANYYQPSMLAFDNAFLDVPDKKDDASPVNHVTGKEPPSLILHGGDDWIVPKTNSMALYDVLVLRGAKSSFELINHYWHCNMIVNYGDPGHHPTPKINKFFADYLPIVKK